MDGDPSISADWGGDHTQALGDNIRHNMEYKADESNYPILISHPHQPTHVNVYVLLTGGGGGTEMSPRTVRSPDSRRQEIPANLTQKW